MHRELLKKLLSAYTPWDEAEQAMVDRTLEFVAKFSDCFVRSQTAGHITGSAWIVDPKRQHVVMIHHKRLGRWFQPGGHSDGQNNTAQVALREAHEETGLTDLLPLGPEPFDVDVHQIPARGNEPAHYHYDVRFLFQAPLDTAPVVTKETSAAAWLDLDRALIHNPERSIERMVDKTRTPHFLARFQPYSLV